MFVMKSSMAKVPKIFDTSSILSNNDDLSSESEMSVLSTDTKVLRIAVSRINNLRVPLSVNL